MSDPMSQDLATVLQSLRQAGACTPGAKPESDACPEQYFCALADGNALCLRPSAGTGQTAAFTPYSAVPTPPPREITGLEVLSVFAVFIAGIAIGRYWRSRKR